VLLFPRYYSTRLRADAVRLEARALEHCGKVTVFISQSMLSQLAAETVEGVRTVRSLGAEAYFGRRYDEALSVAYRSLRAHAWQSGASYGFVNLMLQTAFMAINFSFGAYLVSVRASTPQDVYK